MKYLNKKALGGLVFLLLVMGALLFVAAGTIDYWQAWVFLAVFGLSSLAITLYLMNKDPALLQRRLQVGPITENQLSQKIIQSLTAMTFIAMYIVPGLDHRFGWTTIPFDGVIAGDVLVALGFLIIFFVYKENSFASATIDLYPDQRVIATGPYALVRHPMYLGGLVLFIGIALALGSWWSLAVVLLFIPALLWRLFDEEAFLEKNLPGYSNYRRRIKYRLAPYIW